MRIVSICPSNTEILAYLDAIDLLVGVDDDSDWPLEIDGLPRVGRDLNIDVNKVKELRPDLVLASLSVPGMERNIEQLEEYGLPYIILNPNSLNEIADNIKTVGEEIGKQELADQVYTSFLKTIDQFQNWSNQIENRKKVYWEWWPKPIFTPGGKNWLTEISELAGAYNVFRDYDQASVQTTWEEVIDKEPDEICMVWVGVKEAKMNPGHIKKRHNALSLKPVKENRIHVLEEYLYCRPSPRLLEGLEKLATILHPDHFPHE
ncbi:cobalamin-binding protein [Alkalibacillus aidingensis]|uniref:cobalamin-binding protein n=1 Tax=Alkalibacillus aidingensis TaxID=2747607 RepID=UPI00166130F1|nr:cobalamin-binding protein [Alkalibacillus aidingensis]